MSIEDARPGLRTTIVFGGIALALVALAAGPGSAVATDHGEQAPSTAGASGYEARLAPARIEATRQPASTALVVEPVEQIWVDAVGTGFDRVTVEKHADVRFDGVGAVTVGDARSRPADPAWQHPDCSVPAADILDGGGAAAWPPFAVAGAAPGSQPRHAVCETDAHRHVTLSDPVRDPRDTVTFRLDGLQAPPAPAPAVYHLDVTLTRSGHGLDHVLGASSHEPVDPQPVAIEVVPGPLASLDLDCAPTPVQEGGALHCTVPAESGEDAAGNPQPVEDVAWTARDSRSQAVPAERTWTVNGTFHARFHAPAEADRGPITVEVQGIDREGRHASERATVEVAPAWPMFGLDEARSGARGTTGPGTGEVVWSAGLGSEVVSSPAVVAGTVYVGTEHKGVFALDADTGQQRWRFDSGSQVRSSPAVVGDTVYVGISESAVYALDADSGEPSWRFETDGVVASSPAVEGGTVYVGSYDDHVYAIDADTGEEKWRFETGSTVESSPAVVDGTVYVGSWDDNLYAVDADTGQEEWRFGILAWSTDPTPTVADGTVYVGSRDDRVYAVDADTGQEEWSFATNDWVIASPAVAGDTVYATSTDDHVYALDADTGQEHWRFETGDWIGSSPAVVDGVLYVGSSDGRVRALDAGHG